jgi:ABC-type multidrug transport system ATPase subunit
MMTHAPQGEEILHTEGLSKRYGRITAVDDISLRLFLGEVFSLLGPNGSGKSTTVGMLLGLVRPTKGRVLAFGSDMALHPWPALRRMAAVVETPAFYPYLSGYDNLRTLATMLGNVPAGRIEEMLDLVGLSERARDKCKTYSLGMKQRLGIASTLLRDPDLIILDEPTNGLDPAGTAEVRELIPRLARQGRCVLLCSHLLHEVQQVSDRVGILKKGRLVAQGSVGELLGRGQTLRLKADDNAALERALAGLNWVSRVESVDGFLRVAVPAERSAELNRALAAQGVYLSELAPWETDLESVFLELTDEELADEGAKP